MKFDVHHIREDFPILKRQIFGQPLVYLDNAATSLKPVSVVKRLSDHLLMESSNVHRGIHYLSEQATKEFEAARERVRDFTGAASAREIIFTRGTTEAINLVAHSFGSGVIKAGDEILISEMEHHSNIVPWQLLCERSGAKLRVIPMNDRGELLLDEFKKLLNSKTKLVAVTHVSNALGTINPIEEIIKFAHANGSKVLIDAAQSAAHQKINVQTLGCDFLVFSGHKMLGPTGIGVLYGKEEILTTLPPFLGGGEMIESVTFEKTTYNELPYKFEAGTPPIAEAIALGTAIEYLNHIGLDAIHEYETGLHNQAERLLSEIPGFRLIGAASQKGPIISFLIDGTHPFDVGSLINQDGIALRIGHHCAMPVMEKFKIPGTLRASLAFYNTLEDIKRLKSSLLKALEMLR